jgi:two-component system NtrC family response regulator
MTSGRILVVEDDEGLRRVTKAQLEQGGFEAGAAVDATQALELLRRQPADVVLCDVHLPGMSGMELLKTIRLEFPEVAIVILTAYGTIETAVDAIKSGAFDYITKPIHPDELIALVTRALERRHLIEQVDVLRHTLSSAYGLHNMLGESSAWRRVLDEASRIASTDATVLLQGETGTGKEVLAKAIHFGSLRRDRPFVIISCGSIPRELLESELFGHIRGSFTGAMTHKKGKVEIADGGTVFLDEIGEMPLDLQVRVLRLVQEHEIEKVGATGPAKVDVRIISATHRNLKTLVEAGTFREDLYYRLAVVPINLPSLRERKEDIPVFVEEFFNRLKFKHGRPAMELPSSLLPYFLDYHWPGNIRELENVIERVVLLGRSDQVALEDLPEDLRHSRSAVQLPNPEPEFDTSSLEAAERRLIIQALRRFNWNQSQAARHLDISRKTLMYRIAKYGIEKEVGSAGSKTSQAPGE